MSARIQFDEDTYNQVVTLLGDLRTGLRGLDLPGEVQPPGQTWAPARDLVEAARDYVAALGDWNTETADHVTRLQGTLNQAKGILRDAEDFALVSAEQFRQAIR